MSPLALLGPRAEYSATIVRMVSLFQLPDQKGVFRRRVLCTLTSTEISCLFSLFMLLPGCRNVVHLVQQVLTCVLWRKA